MTNEAVLLEGAGGILIDGIKPLAGQDANVWTEHTQSLGDGYQSVVMNFGLQVRLWHVF